MPNPPLGTRAHGAPPDIETIDALIPPPWSRTRRLVVGGVILALIAVAGLAVRSGLLGPQLEHVPAWGFAAEPAPDGTIVAERSAPIRNNGMLPVDVQELALPPIAGLVWLDVSGIPTTLAPGEQVEVTVRFEVRDCGLDVAGLDDFPIRARSGIAPARVVDVAAPASSDPEFRGSEAGPGASEDVLAAWAPQPASWVLDTIASICLDPDDAPTPSGGGADR